LLHICYGDKNHIRIPEEAAFWKRQESEHTVVIREIVPDLEQRYVEQLIEYQGIFNAVEATIVQYFSRLNRTCYMMNAETIDTIVNLIDQTAAKSQAFVEFLTNMVINSTAVQNNPVAPVVINHIIRESKYYIGIANAYITQVAYS